MRIVLNGSQTEVEPGTTVGQLVDRLVKDRSRVAVECNREIVRRTTYDATAVKTGDVVEVVTLVGGG